MMGKDQELLRAVRDQDVHSVEKILHKNRASKSKIIGSGKRLNINHQDNDGMAALHQAALVGNVEILQALLESGASVDVKDNKGMRPLHYAAWQGKEEPVKLLLKWGSSSTEAAYEGETPLHLACQHGHHEVVNILLCYHADSTSVNKDHKTPIDLACEFGRYRVVELLLSSNLCSSLLQSSPNDMLDNNRTTCLHLAAKNGHSDILRLLLYAGVDINRQTLQGTCLHEAALCGKIEVVKLLLDCGVDVNRSNSYDQTALDIVNRFTTSRAAKELKQLLKEASFAQPAQAIQDYSNSNDPDAISFREGDFIQVLDQRPDGVWKGYVMQDSHNQTGYFPSSAVDLFDKSIATNRAISMKPVQTRKPPLPLSQPDLINRSHLPPPPSVSSHYSSVGHDESFPPPPPSQLCHQNNQNRSPGHSRQESYDSGHSGLVFQPQIPYSSGKFSPSPIEQMDWSNRYGDPNDMRSASPNRDSPSSSNRNSAASSDSGRSHGSSSYDGKGIPNYVNIQLSQHRLSGQSYESGVSSRQSYHSTSSSSLGSLDRLEESGYSSQVNVAELVQSGMSQDHEIIHAWLADLRYEEYYNNFIINGYDMGTISRMTPEDLTAIGVTKPGHRKRLKAEITRLHIPDGLPDYKPSNLFEWLQALNLVEYHDTLSRQGYENLDLITDITWEDLEEIGIKKLGHQKKFVLAIDRLKRIDSGAKRQSISMDRRGSSEILDGPHVVHHHVPSRWANELGNHPQFSQEVTIVQPRRSPSGENVNMMPPEMKSFQHPDGIGSQELLYRKPDVVAINVSRSRLGSTDSGGGHSNRSDSPVMFQSFHGMADSEKEGEMTPTNERSSTPDNLDRDGSLTRRPAAVVSPRISNKPKPVAMIVAKTRRGSRDGPPEIIPMEKPDPLSKDYIYNENHDSNSLKNSYSPGPGSPKSTAPPSLLLAAKCKKVPPPPPPKRTNSVSSIDSKISEDEELQESQPSLPTVSQASSNLDSNNSASVRSLAGRFQHQTSITEENSKPMSPKIKELKSAAQLDNFKNKPPQSPVVHQPPIVHDKPYHSGPGPAVRPKPILSETVKTKEILKSHEIVKPKDILKSKEFMKKEPPKVMEKPRRLSKEDIASHKPVSSFNPLPMGKPPIIDKSPAQSDGEEDTQTIRRVKVKRNESTTSIDSNLSTCSTDSNTLPFANENVGTIKQRNAQSKPSIVPVSIDGEDSDEDAYEETATMKRRPVPRPVGSEKGAANTEPLPEMPVSSNFASLTADYPDSMEDALSGEQGKESGDVLNDIGNMLQDLTNELDAMLDLEVEDS
ncbi:caskin-2-like isoform X3 [Lineus longissimus]|uniref:caskin-2-like isoform X3 n=1 Tax=Lineus longissimus TaxID=88925 RepID=UPI002B4CA724